MALSNKKRLILSKIETVSGTARTDWEAKDAVLCSNLTISPLEGASVERNLIRPYFGSSGSIRAENYVTLSFDTELASGAGTQLQPQWHNLIQSCGFKSTGFSAATGLVSGLKITGNVGANAASGATTVVLAPAASIIDGYYVGRMIKVGTQVAQLITAYNATTKTVTVGAAIGVAQSVTAGALTPYEIYYAPITGALAGTSTTSLLTQTLTLATSSGTTDYKGRSIKIGAETRTIISYIGSNRTATVLAFTSLPPNGTNYEISSANELANMRLTGLASQSDSAYVGLSITVSINGINETREIIGYNGLTQVAQVYPAFSSVPLEDCTYALGAATSYEVTSDIPGAAGASSSSFAVNIDGENHIIYGARGTFSLDLTVKQIPVIKWSFTGLLGTFEASTRIDGDFSNWILPEIVNATNTPILHLCGYAPVISKLSIDIGNTVSHRLMIGSESVIISDRKPKGSVTIEATVPMLNSYLNLVKNDAAGWFFIRHGSVAGKQVSIIGPQVQLGSPKYSEQDGVVMLDMSMDFQPLLSSASIGGNNEIRIVCK